MSLNSNMNMNTTPPSPSPDERDVELDERRPLSLVRDSLHLGSFGSFPPTPESGSGHHGLAGGGAGGAELGAEPRSARGGEMVEDEEEQHARWAVEEDDQSLSILAPLPREMPPREGGFLQTSPRPWSHHDSLSHKLRPLPTPPALSPSSPSLSSLSNPAPNTNTPPTSAGSPVRPQFLRSISRGSVVDAPPGIAAMIVAEEGGSRSSSAHASLRPRPSTEFIPTSVGGPRPWQQVSTISSASSSSILPTSPAMPPGPPVVDVPPGSLLSGPLMAGPYPVWQGTRSPPHVPQTLPPSASVPAPQLNGTTPMTHARQPNAPAHPSLADSFPAPRSAPLISSCSPAIAAAAARGTLPPSSPVADAGVRAGSVNRRTSQTYTPATILSPAMSATPNIYVPPALAAGAAATPAVPVPPFPPVFATQPGAEVCLECMMRDRDLADVDVGPAAWARTSDADFEEALRIGQEEMAPASVNGSVSVESGFAGAGAGSSETRVDAVRHGATRGELLTEEKLRLWTSMNPPATSHRWRTLHAYLKEQARYLAAEERARLEASRESSLVESRMRDTYSQLRTQAYDHGVSASIDLDDTGPLRVPAPRRQSGAGSGSGNVLLLESGMIVEQIDTAREAKAAQRAAAKARRRSTGGSSAGNGAAPAPYGSHLSLNLSLQDAPPLPAAGAARSSVAAREASMDQQQRSSTFRSSSTVNLPHQLQPQSPSSPSHPHASFGPHADMPSPGLSTRRPFSFLFRHSNRSATASVVSFAPSGSMMDMHLGLEQDAHLPYGVPSRARASSVNALDRWTSDERGSASDAEGSVRGRAAAERAGPTDGDGGGKKSKMKKGIRGLWDRLRGHGSGNGAAAGGGVGGGVEENGQQQHRRRTQSPIPRSVNKASAASLLNRNSDLVRLQAAAAEEDANTPLPPPPSLSYLSGERVRGGHGRTASSSSTGSQPQPSPSPQQQRTSIVHPRSYSAPGPPEENEAAGPAEVVVPASPQPQPQRASTATDLLSAGAGGRDSGVALDPPPELLSPRLSQPDLSKNLPPLPPPSPVDSSAPDASHPRRESSGTTSDSYPPLSTEDEMYSGGRKAKARSKFGFAALRGANRSSFASTTSPEQQQQQRYAPEIMYAGDDRREKLGVVPMEKEFRALGYPSESEIGRLRR